MRVKHVEQLRSVAFRVFKVATCLREVFRFEFHTNKLTALFERDETFAAHAHERAENHIARIGPEKQRIFDHVNLERADVAP